MRLRHVAGAAGVDEAGRGPLAGPVVAAAVILPPGFRRGGVDDSKKLSPEQREALARRIRRTAVWAIASASPGEIDRMNILRATLEAMRRAVDALADRPAEVLVDGNALPFGLENARAEIDGDARFACIAAASILAKCHRDGLMREAARQYPEYGFDRHFGYATPEHLQALREHGPCPLHRRSFAPVAEVALQGCLF